MFAECILHTAEPGSVHSPTCPLFLKYLTVLYFSQHISLPVLNNCLLNIILMSSFEQIKYTYTPELTLVITSQSVSFRWI